ncbi:MAG: AAA family ATPase [Pyrinomonadaceae bacterium]
MHISKIELENIKSHVSTTIEFQRGTTAITGENGAGKTTIIEAIAWVLFDLLEYKKEDFVRRGAKKGSVTVTFESGLDEREYIVYRDSGSGYHVIDPRLQMRIADKKEEVFRFLWQHLGLEPGTDLKSLFRQAIGVPQGTFTAIFLEGSTERKVAFDRLLKVEEYRQAAEKLRETTRYLDLSISGIKEDIARSEGELTRSDAVEQEHKRTTEQTAELSVEIEQLSADLETRQTRVKALDEEEHRLSGLKTALDRSRSEKERAELVFKQSHLAHERATIAADKITTVRPDHERHVATLGRLTELERERNKRDQLRAELNKTATAIASVNAEKARLDRDLKNILDAREEIILLRPKAAEQEALEKEIAALRNDVASAKTADERVRSINSQLERTRERYRQNQQDLKAVEEGSITAASLPGLEKRESELVAAVAKLRANLERDEKFQSEVRNGLCPILSQRCLNLKDGETLETYLSSQFIDLKSQISDLETERKTVVAELIAAREGQKALGARDSYLQRDRELRDEGAGLNAKKAALEQQQRDLVDSERKIAESETRLKGLADPSARIRILEKELMRETDIREGLGNVESNLERLTSDRKLLDEQLEEFKELDAHWTRLTSERDATAEAHRVFLANETEANALEQRKVDLEGSSAELASKSALVEAAENDLAAAGSDYDPDRHKTERTELLNVERRSAEIRATFEAAKRRETQLAAELARFAELRKSLAEEFREKERLEKVAEATAFIRDTLKEAAPRVARNYVHHVSLEANQMFREITGNGDRTLKWADDYSIILEEDGFERPFVSLSGGEQMSAALSVRLALLKQLSDIRIAFFDEPTTNMDAERRENFAQQISRITHFDQLFVISHDDTFEGYMDHEMRMEGDSSK